MSKNATRETVGVRISGKGTLSNRHYVISECGSHLAEGLMGRSIDFLS